MGLHFFFSFLNQWMITLMFEYFKSVMTNCILWLPWEVCKKCPAAWYGIFVPHPYLLCHYPSLGTIFASSSPKVHLAIRHFLRLRCSLQYCKWSAWGHSVHQVEIGLWRRLGQTNSALKKSQWKMRWFWDKSSSFLKNLLKKLIFHFKLWLLGPITLLQEVGRQVSN